MTDAKAFLDICPRTAPMPSRFAPTTRISDAAARSLFHRKSSVPHLDKQRFLVICLVVRRPNNQYRILALTVRAVDIRTQDRSVPHLRRNVPLDPQTQRVPSISSQRRWGQKQQKEADQYVSRCYRCGDLFNLSAGLAYLVELCRTAPSYHTPTIYRTPPDFRLILGLENATYTKLK